MAGTEKVSVDNMDSRKRIEELIATLNDASRAYYDDASEVMTNFEYDALYDELEALEKKSGIVMANSPTRNVGYTVQSELPKERHPSRMLSLDKTKDREELKAWLGDNEGILSWKLDGLTIVITYRNRELVKAVTRGNGDVGEVVTENARTFENIPFHIPFTGEVVIRGEAVILYKDFEHINAAIDDADAKYKNPRNLCSGSVRQLDSRITAERHVRFYAFTVTSADNLDFGFSKIEELRWLESQGFEVVPYEKVNGTNLLGILGKFEDQVRDFAIPSDGLVLALEDLALASRLGETAKFPRHSIAFKWADQQAETTLRQIEWSPSRTGLLNPVAVFDPVELEGTTVRRASVHNVNVLKNLKLGIGDKITVYKANMIIPQIADNLTGSGSLEIPSSCPVCGDKTDIKIEGTTEVLVCTNPDCLAKQSGRFTLFVSRDAMNIEGLSEQTILKFIGRGFIKSFADIYKLEEFREEISSMDGFGKKSFDKLITSIDNSRNTTPARLLYALGISGIGVATSALISKHCKNKWEEIQHLQKDELLTIEGIGGVIANDFVKFFKSEKNIEIIKSLIPCLNMDESYEESGTALTGKVFVITGSLTHYSNRKELKSAIENAGGKVASSVSSSTDFLITNNPNSGSSKNKAARELGVSIITEEQAIEMLG